MRHLLHTAIAAIVCLATLGCTNPQLLRPVVAPTATTLPASVACPDIEPPTLTALLEGYAPPDNAVAAIDMAWPASTLEHYEGYDDFAWNANDVRYSLHFSNGEATKASVEWRASMPALHAFRDCLGDPAYFLYVMEHGMYTLTLYWPERGISAELTWTVEGGQPLLDWDAQVHRISLVRPGSIEQVVRANYRLQASEAREAFEVGRLREWPGRLELLTPVRCHEAPYPCKPPE